MVLRQAEQPGDAMERERQTPSSFTERAARGVDAKTIAALAAARWYAIEGALAPVIGVGGVAALHRRSLHLTRPAFGWLTLSSEGHADPHPFAAMQMALSRQTAANAGAASDALLQSFHDLLSKLIGVALTEQLLLPVWSQPPLHGSPPENTPP